MQGVNEHEGSAGVPPAVARASCLRFSRRRRSLWELRDQLQHGLFDLLPRRGAWINQVEVICAANLQQVSVFFLFPRTLLFGRHIVLTELGRHYVIRLTMNQELPRLRNRKLH